MSTASTVLALLALLVFPAGLSALALGLLYQWANRKLLARLQNRVGPRLLQPLADLVKLITKQEIVPQGTTRLVFSVLPVVALAGALTAALYVPLFGLAPSFSFPGDLVVTIYLLALLTLCLSLAGANTNSRFALVGTTRVLTQLFSYEAPFLLALLGPAIAAGSWQISAIAANNAEAGRGWLLFSQSVGFLVAIIGLMGKLELPPFDAPEAETEIVAGVLTEYSGRGLAFFRLARDVEMVVGLTLIAAVYLGGVVNPLDFAIKTLSLLAVVTVLQALLARRRIDQTVSLWWRVGALAALGQTLAILLVRI